MGWSRWDRNHSLETEGKYFLATVGPVLGPLHGYTIGITADRRSSEQISMLTGRGAECVHGPTIKTHPLRPEAEMRAATEAFLADPPEIVVLTTGIGVRGWLAAADSLMLGEDLRRALAGSMLISRGPKARGALVTADLDVAWNAPRATSAEVIDYLAELDLGKRRVAVQLDGAAGSRLMSGLAALGVDAMPIPVYRWSLPDDLGPAESLIRSICEGRIDAVTFTARPAVENFAEIAQSMGRFDEVVEAFERRVRFFCIGPVCASGAVASGFTTVFEPERSRLGALSMFVTSTLAADNGEIQLGGRRLVMQGRMVMVDGENEALLAARERQLLDVLLSKPGAVHSKDALLKRVWGPAETDTHVVEVTVGRLRQRLGSAGVGIETVMRRGYRASET